MDMDNDNGLEIEIGEIQRVSDELATQIIRTRRPLGRFYHRSESDGRVVYTAIDNSTGDAWCEDFWTLQSAKKYLNGQPCRDMYGEWH